MPVLLVEDDPTLLEFLKILLHRSGLRDVDSVSRGDAALDAIRSEAFDAIVLDLALPEMSGFEVIRKVRETHPHLIRRIIVLSGVSRVVLNDLPFAPLLWDVIRKPFDIEGLTRSLTTCIAFHTSPRPQLQHDACEWLEQRSTSTAAKAGVVAAAGGGKTLDLRAAFGYRPKVAEAYFPLPVNAPFPICSAVRNEHAVWLASVITDSTDYPLLAPVWKANRSLAIAAVPIIENGRAVGAVAWSFKEPQRFDERQRDSFVRLARECLPLVERRNARAS
jgi:CheY-like chemotaxis protein